MSSRSLAGALSVLALAAMLGGGGYLYWKLHLKQQDTAQRLEQTQASLAKTAQILAALKEEHQTLSSEYDTLKERWKTTDEQLQRITTESTELKTQVASLSTERAALQRQVDETKVEQNRLQGQLKTREQELASSKTARATLETQLSEVAVRAITPFELQQVASAIAEQQMEHTRLTDRLERLSRDYEQLASAAPAARQGEIVVGQPRSPARASPDAARSARLYRDLGDAYLTTNRYAEAARMFEQSLTLHEDPEVHSRLAFLYSRLLHNPTEAARHAAMASDRDEVTAGLAAASRADGLPRKSTRLVWRWLTQ